MVFAPGGRLNHEAYNVEQFTIIDVRSTAADPLKGIMGLCTFIQCDVACLFIWSFVWLVSFLFFCMLLCWLVGGPFGVVVVWLVDVLFVFLFIACLLDSFFFGWLAGWVVRLLGWRVGNWQAGWPV